MDNEFLNRKKKLDDKLISKLNDVQEKIKANIDISEEERKKLKPVEFLVKKNVMGKIIPKVISITSVGAKKTQWGKISWTEVINQEQIDEFIKNGKLIINKQLWMYKILKKRGQSNLFRFLSIKSMNLFIKETSSEFRPAIIHETYTPYTKGDCYINNHSLIPGNAEDEYILDDNFILDVNGEGINANEASKMETKDEYRKNNVSILDDYIKINIMSTTDGDIEIEFLNLLKNVIDIKKLTMFLDIVYQVDLDYFCFEDMELDFKNLPKIFPSDEEVLNYLLYKPFTSQKLMKLIDFWGHERLKEKGKALGFLYENSVSIFNDFEEKTIVLLKKINSWGLKVSKLFLRGSNEKIDDQVIKLLIEGFTFFKKKGEINLPTESKSLWGKKAIEMINLIDNYRTKLSEVKADDLDSININVLLDFCLSVKTIWKKFIPNYLPDYENQKIQLLLNKRVDETGLRIFALEENNKMSTYKRNVLELGRQYLQSLESRDQKLDFIKKFKRVVEIINNNEKKDDGEVTNAMENNLLKEKDANEIYSFYKFQEESDGFSTQVKTEINKLQTICGDFHFVPGEITLGVPIPQFTPVIKGIKSEFKKPSTVSRRNNTENFYFELKDKIVYLCFRYDPKNNSISVTEKNHIGDNGKPSHSFYYSKDIGEEYKNNVGKFYDDNIDTFNKLFSSYISDVYEWNKNNEGIFYFAPMVVLLDSNGEDGRYEASGTFYLSNVDDGVISINEIQFDDYKEIIGYLKDILKVYKAATGYSKEIGFETLLYNFPKRTIQSKMIKKKIKK